MKLKELLMHLNIFYLEDKEVTDVVFDTRKIVKDCLLICIKGEKINPSLLLNNHIKEECALILSDEINQYSMYVENLADKAFDLLYYFHFQDRKIFKFYGVLATEGKSSFVQILNQYLNKFEKTLLFSNENRIYNSFKVSLTTPSLEELFDGLIYARENNYKNVILEISSSGILKKRISNKIFDYLFLLNLEKDHLDIHENIFAYHKTKIDFFVNNHADKYIFKYTYKKYPYLIMNAVNLHIVDENLIKIKNISLEHMILEYQGNHYYTHLTFKANVLNLAMLFYFIEDNKLLLNYKIIKSIRRIKGRNDLINKRPYIIIDYAHSVKAFENILKAANNFKQNKMIIVFGLGGNRDKTKRKEIGILANNYGDKVILTNDNPRLEDPLKIIEEIKGSFDFEVIIRRDYAIKKALEIASKDDIILILGRGNEDYQIFKNKKIYFNDYEVVKRLLHD